MPWQAQLALGLVLMGGGTMWAGLARRPARAGGKHRAPQEPPAPSGPGHKVMVAVSWVAAVALTVMAVATILPVMVWETVMYRTARRRKPLVFQWGQHR